LNWKEKQNMQETEKQDLYMIIIYRECFQTYDQIINYILKESLGKQGILFLCTTVFSLLNLKILCFKKRLQAILMTRGRRSVLCNEINSQTKITSVERALTMLINDHDRKKITI
jgi:hypothetical protein